MLDASVIVGAHLPDEQSLAAIAVFSEAKDVVFHVPQIWHVEVGNALLMAVRRSRMPEQALSAAIRKIEGLDVVVDPRTGQSAWHETLHLAQKHRLSLYDASHLELASRLEAALATLDSRLVTAAREENVELAVK